MDNSNNGENNGNRSLKGGEWLIRPTSHESIFIPEEFTEEDRMMGETARQFVETEVYPNLDRIDSMEEGLMESLLDKAAELGLLGLAIPADLGGMDLDFKTTMYITEVLGAAHSFSVAQSAHTGIGTLPILYYGNDAQKEKYLPKLASGEYKAAYCLTEPGSGSDANAAKTKATPVDGGSAYLINGQKMWITNSGFADIFIVFAKIEDDKNLSAFIVEKSFGGVDLNPEEHKMGIKGSSTRQVFFNDCKVPAENMLHERESGFKIALNILNIGRLKLGAGVLGGAKMTTTHSIKYANEREQFGRPISKYGAIRYKLAQQATLIYAAESAVYRVTADITQRIKSLTEEGKERNEAALKGIEEYAAECAMMKVLGSEVLDYVVDEGVQIFGGMGYSMETPVERAYRDARINRIFEGTNEINRMLTVEMILKKAMKGELELTQSAMAVANELTSIPEMAEDDGQPFFEERQLVEKFKKSVLMVAGSAAQKLMQTLGKEQEILMNIADMMIWTYTAESVLLRTTKLVELKGEDEAKERIDMMRVYIHDAADLISKAGKDAIHSFAEGDERQMMLMGLRRYTKTKPLNVKEARQRVALAMIEKDAYPY